VSARELLAAGPPTTSWLVEGLVPAKVTMDFQGLSKEGKSTFLRDLALGVVRGGTFLGRPCRKSPVVYVTEEAGAALDASLRRAGADEGDLILATGREIRGRDFEGIVADVRAECEAREARLAIFDTLFHIAGLGPSAENDGGTAREIYRLLKTLIDDGVTVVVVRHTRKAGGRANTAGLGSSAWASEPDELVTFGMAGRGHGAGVRRLEWTGRVCGHFVVLAELTADGWGEVEEREATSAAPASAARSPSRLAEGTRSVVLHALAGVGAAGATAKEIVEWARSAGGWAPKIGAVRNALDGLITDELVEIVNKDGGVREDPFRFALQPSTPAP
jgi:hypothetical protein